MNILQVDSLSRVFGGVSAVADLSFSISKGKVHAIIGPNGAGKTTLFNLITGVYQPSSGTINFAGQELAGKSVDQRARLGITRTFQNLQICMNMTALENVMLGEHQHLDSGFVSSLFRLPGLVSRDRACREDASELMRFVGLESYLDADANAMPYGALKRLEIARALAAKPGLLLLDEPAAGLNGSETAEIGNLINKLSDQGVSIVLVEHDMSLVMSVSKHIIALNYGRKIAEGTVDEIRRNPDVIAAYLGASGE
ncbi:branched-chain amino acid transport system ATP-binding protein [Ochrobactrum intermedium]|uniref:Branched-chain amino acid transport system ATP-binding protein n=1 Tax=Brucella intermedia TaxID=94625 RepID=A0ABR6AVH8_9HYPH|nr:ABC transporter ATP-binding protein [Brucella intermedia]MBA8853475.1 branched-chain amino acid transport system ATP-binding protein [Brucella intermedia]